jgi:hypothetical protein
MNIRQTIKKVLREELYSPAGDEYTPGKFLIHKSNPVWRDDIKRTGLKASVGECYKIYSQNFSKEECKPAIFATDSENENYWYDSTWDDDIWVIDTKCAGVIWYKDNHYKGGDYEYNILTFENISPECLELIYKGSS